VTETLANSNTSDGSYVISEKHLNGINNNEVWYYKVVGGGHDWPGDQGNMDIDAGEEVWLFFQKYIDDTLSSSNFEDTEKSIVLTPNPTYNTLFIKGNKNLMNVSVYNMLGKEVLSKMNTNNIDVNVLPKGVYIIKISDDVGKINRKFIKN
jgi:polyhydroxybutyrate depolymerase